MLLVCCSLAGEQLLAAVDVVVRTRERRVAHDMYGERGDVGRPDDAPNGERGAELMAPLLKVIAEERRRQGCIDEAGRDQVDPDGRAFQRQVGDHPDEVDTVPLNLIRPP